MSAPIPTLIENLAPLVDVQPEWGWYVALAWDASVEPPRVLGPWRALASLAHVTPDAHRLSRALDDAAATSASGIARATLLFHAGFLLPAGWAPALDDLHGPDVPRFGVTPRFLDLVRMDPARAERRVELAQKAGLASRIAVDFVYAAVIACVDAGLPLTPGIARHQARVENAERTLVDQAARYVGRLRLAARTDAEAAARLAHEAVREAGADAVYAGLWSVMARAAEPRALAQRVVAAFPHAPTPQVILSLLARCGAARAGEVEVSARALVADVAGEAIDGRRAWPAAWRLLGAGVATGASAAVESILALRPPAWAVELATWRELRSASPELCERLCRRQADATGPGHALEAPQAPPWGSLPAAIFAARLRLLSDADVPLPSGFAWEDAVP